MRKNRESPERIFFQTFDFSFSESIAVQVIGVVYAVGLIVAGLIALSIIVSVFGQGAAAGLAAVVVSPLIFLLYAILIRLGLGSFIVTIRTADNTRRMAEYLRSSDR
jgi:small-conductance mechanosensitive channel